MKNDIQHLDSKQIADQLATVASNTVLFNMAGSGLSGNATNVTVSNYPNLIDYTWWYPYTSTYFSDTYNKFLVVKAENGFVLTYQNKTWIAKNETEVAKLITKTLSPKETKK